MSLAFVFLGSVKRRKLATALSFLAIALGVALGVAVQTIHSAALAEIERSSRQLAGEADWRVQGGSSGFDDALWPRLAMHPAVLAASPVVELDARLLREDGSLDRPLRLLGIDVFRHVTINSRWLPRPYGDRLDLLAEDAIFLTPAAREAAGANGTVTLLAGEERYVFRIAGELPALDSDQRLAVIDIAAAQKHFAFHGRIHRIDLRLAPSAEPAAIAAVLPPGLTLERPTAASDHAARISRAYRINLGLLASLALATGFFLVFSTQALAVVRRQSEFAFLRALGLDPRTLFRGLLAEGGAIGLVGGIAGIPLGWSLAWLALAWFGGDLGAGFFAEISPSLRLSPAGALSYLLLAGLAGVAGAWLPARQALRMAPALALKGEAMEPPPARLRRGVFVGFALLAGAALAALLPPWHELPLGGYLAVALLLAGSVLLLPLFSIALARRAARPLLFLPIRLALLRLAATPGHAILAMAGVMTSIALAWAMTTMVHSFRVSLERWLEEILPAELHLRARAGRSHSALLSPALQEAITALPEVAHVEFARYEKLPLLADRPAVTLLARSSKRLPLVGRQVPMTEPTVWISEALADFTGWRPGDVVELPLAGRLHRFGIAGLWRDYARQTGAIVLDLAAFRALTGDLAVHEAAISLTPGANVEAVRQKLAALAPPGALEIVGSGEIRRASLALFDRTFFITYWLEAVAIVIGLAGVAASFGALTTARRKEFGMLRHLGLSRRQIAMMLGSEGVFLASAGVSMGGLSGFAIAAILIEVINRQSFHWSMDWAVPWGTLTVFAATMIGLATLTAVFAGRLAMQPAAVLAVREDW